MLKPLLKRLSRRGLFRINPSLERVSSILDRLGNPHSRLRVVHIAGTNGKGSVAAGLESVLRQAGYRTGLYTSPHLSDVRERIQMNRQLISAASFEHGSRLILEAERSVGQALTYFEFLTVLAFVTFFEEQVDIAVLETGMGGRWDATNVHPHPEVCVITSIGKDHTEWLGRTEETIAGEKAGILKPGVPVISGARGRAAKVIRRTARKMGSPLHEMDRDFYTERIGTDWAGGKEILHYHGSHLHWSGSFGLVGAHQVDNASLVLAAIETLVARGWALPVPAVQLGLQDVSWPARFQKLHFQDRHLIIDGAHNPHGVQRLINTLADSPWRKASKTLIFGVYRDKAYVEMINLLSSDFQNVVVCTAPGARGLPARELGRLFSRRRQRSCITVAASPEQALRAACQGCPDKGLMVAAGSLALAGALEKAVY